MSAKSRRVALGLCGAAALAALAAAVGCGAFGSGKAFASVKGGKVVSLQIALEEAEGGICPGSTHQLVILATTRFGSTLTSWRPGEGGAEPVTKGHLDYAEFKAKITGGRLQPDGRFEAHPDALFSMATGYKIAIAPADTGTPVAELTVPTRLDCATSVDLRGAAGKDGAAGGDGAAPAADASVADEAAAPPVAAGAGGFATPVAAVGSTTDGLPGEDGGYGTNAVDAEVASTLVSTPFHPAAVLIRVKPAGRAARHFLADPAAAEGFAIDCRGGDGGNGGDGGRGGPAGNGGPGGGGGDGGDGAAIRGFFDAGQMLLATYMKYLFFGGEAGSPGKGGAAGERDAEGRPMLPGRDGTPGQPGQNGPLPDIRPEGGVNLFPDLPEGVYVLPTPWVPGQAAAPPPAQAP
jgi:hypothetical protein